MRSFLFSIHLWILLCLLHAAPIASAAQDSPDNLSVFASLPMRPGHVAVTTGSRVFATVHPLDAPSSIQLMEIYPDGHYQAWPNEWIQHNKDSKSWTADELDSPLGLTVDKKGRLWVTDMGLHYGKTRVWGFNIETGKVIKCYELCSAVAPKNSYVQDLAVDEYNGWIFLADINAPSIIALDMSNGRHTRFVGHASLSSEPGCGLNINGQEVLKAGKPSTVGIQPITLSADRETLFYGAMNGKSWYSIPTKLFRDGKHDYDILPYIRLVGNKPVCDGAATDAFGNHYFTNINENGVDMLTVTGKLLPLARDPRLDWPDHLSIAPDGESMLIAVNQVYKTKAFTKTDDFGKPPYFIYKLGIPKDLWIYRTQQHLSNNTQKTTAEQRDKPAHPAIANF